MQNFLSLDETLLLETPPKLIDDQDFNLSKYAINISIGKKLLKQKKEVYEETNNYVLFRTGDNTKGYIVLLHKETNYMDFIVKIHNKNIGSLGNFTIQKIVWRSYNPHSNYESIQKLASHVFFDIILKKYGKIMSDVEQTSDGRRSWESRIAFAVKHNMKVGFIHYKKDTDIDWYDKTIRIEEWIESKDAWNEKNGEMKRFIITK